MVVQAARRAPIGVQRRMMELGRIRYGEVVQPREKGKKPYPRALDKFRLTSASRSILDAAGELYGAAKPVREWTDAPNPGMWELYTDSAELAVVLPPILSGDDGSPTYPYSQAWELWDGPTCARRCDGEVAVVPKGRGLAEVACLCDPEDRACSITTRISVMLPDLPGIGLWRMDTHGMNAAAYLPGTLQLLTMAAARNTYLRCNLRLEHRTSKRRGEDGKVETHRFIVPVLDPGITPGQLLAATSPETLNVGRIGNGAKPELPAPPARPTESLEKPQAELGEPPALPSTPLVPDEQPGQEHRGDDGAATEHAAPGSAGAGTPAPASSDGDTWMKAVHALGKERGLDHDAIHDLAVERFDVASLNDLNPLQRGQLRQQIEQLPIEQAAAAEPAADPEPESSVGSPLAEAPAPVDFDAIYRMAVEHGLAPAATSSQEEDWSQLYRIASAAYPEVQPTDLDDAGWTDVAAQIAAGVHDPKPRPRSGS